MAATSWKSTSSGSVRRSATSVRSRCCSRERSAKTSPRGTPAQALREFRRLLRPPTPTTSSYVTSREGMSLKWERRALFCPAARSK
ncbi:unnamed protein product [Ectocarpus sp. 12 AP-2014]